MATVTALRAAGRDRVAVELDGAPWRTLPLEAVARAGLRAGGELDRPRARELRRELRRLDALCRATRALRMRDRPARELDERLERGGVPAQERTRTLETLTSAGIVDDARFARSRAAGMAARGFGDAAIDHDLEQRGVGAEEREQALAALEPEGERARAIVARRGASPATARMLARKGFDEDAVEGAVGTEL